MKVSFLLTMLVFVAGSVCGSEGSQAEGEVRTAVGRFLRAFEDLDMQSFMRCFAADATVFFPVPEPPNRFDGKAAIQARFEQVFAGIRQSSSSSTPPFHQLTPERLRVQFMADSVAVVSFEMSNKVRVARRTLIFQKQGDTWLITHLHASNVARP